MTLVATQGVWMPAPPSTPMDPTFTSSVIDATGEKFAWVGRVWNKDRATKNITKVGFLFGTVTKAGGSAMTVSLQDVSLTAGPPFQPDGTPDQTVAIANADAAFVTNGYYMTGALSATRTVAFGELLAVVIEYDGAGRLGADVVNLRNLTMAGSGNRCHSSGISLFTSSWATANVWPSILLEFDDGTFGTVDMGLPVSNTSATAVHTGTTPDEIALQFTVPFSCKVDCVYMSISPNAANFDIVLYEGTTVKATVSVDYNSMNSNATGVVYLPIPEVTLTLGTTYYLAVKPTTATFVQVNWFEVTAANHLQAHAGGTSWCFSGRTDGGAWDAPTTTKRLLAGIRISALDDGLSAGGMIRHPGMQGGLSA